jgi:hypothetical protein
LLPVKQNRKKEGTKKGFFSPKAEKGDDAAGGRIAIGCWNAAFHEQSICHEQIDMTALTA